MCLATFLEKASWSRALQTPCVFAFCFTKLPYATDYLYQKMVCPRKAKTRSGPLKFIARKAKKSELAYLWGVQTSHFLAFGLPSILLSSDTQRQLPRSGDSVGSAAALHSGGP